MQSPKAVLPINELKVGMVSASNINFEGKVLLADGIVITESILYKLIHTYIVDKVEVYSDKDTRDALSIRTKTVKEIENVFNEFSGKLEGIFNDMSVANAQGIQEIRAFSKKIQDELNSVGVVIRDIILFGSGNDNIYRHTINVTSISFILGKWLGLEEKELNLLTYSAILHDFGKTKISKDILNKKGRLSSSEYEIFKTHPVIGYNFVKHIPYLDPSVSYAVLMHHEALDGSGYPLHIRGNKIHKFAKIIAIADMFDDINSNRYTETIKGPFDALKAIQQESFGRLDNYFCNMFLNHIINYFIGESVMLNNEQAYKVIKFKMDDLTKPLLLDDNRFLDLAQEKDLYVERLIM